MRGEKLCVYLESNSDSPVKQLAVKSLQRLAKNKLYAGFKFRT